MKNVIKIFTIGALMISTMTFNAVTAKPLDNHTSKEANEKLEAKIRETSKSIAKEIGLDAKQTDKVYSIKLEEAKAIEAVRADKSIAQNETNNKILMIKNDANGKIEKLLNKDQKVLWAAKKDNFDYNPGFFENVKDKYNQTKENIQERREEKKSAE